MSKVKTRQEIKQEMESLASQIETMKADHAGQISDLEAKVSELTATNETATAQIESLKSELETANAEGVKAADALTEAKAQIESLSAEKAEVESHLTKAKLALANPAHLDAAITPTEINQTVEDAAADHQERDAEDDTPKSELETYESMPQGADRLAYYRQHKHTIIKQMDERDESQD